MKKIELELDYLKNQSFIYDLKIIYKTVLIVSKKKGVIH